MIEKIKDFFQKNKVLLIVTVELFWLIIFLLNQLGSETASEIPQFIYVNF